MILGDFYLLGPTVSIAAFKNHEIGLNWVVDYYDI